MSNVEFQVDLISWMAHDGTLIFSACFYNVNETLWLESNLLKGWNQSGSLTPEPTRA